jgi:hypothetical protein
MAILREQNVVFRLGKTSVDTHKSLCGVYNKETLSKPTQIYEWRKLFQSGSAFRRDRADHLFREIMFLITQMKDIPADH